MLEDLPNELILLIYSYLELTELYRCFSCLNSRFDALLYNNFTLFYARLPSQHNLPLENFSFRINNLCLINWDPNNVLSLVNETNFPRLHCLKIESTDNLYFGKPTNDLIHRIVSLSKLCQCQINLSPTLYLCDYKLPISNTLQYLSLSMITLDMLFHLLIHVPKLRLLNVWLNSNGRKFDSNTYDKFYCCLNLKKLILGLHNDVTFEEVLFLFPRMPILHSLEMFGSVWDRHFLDYQPWENILLGQNLFPLLNKIKIDLSVRYSNNVPHFTSLSSQFKKSIFRRTNFSVTYDNMFWFHIKCLFNI